VGRLRYVKDFNWKKGIAAWELADGISNIGFQGTELGRAADVIVKMKKAGAKIFLTFTSNMVTSGLRGFFAQTIRLGMADAVVTTVGSIEEDIMRSESEKFLIGSFNADDMALNEEGVNRVGNLFIKNESYERFEGIIGMMLKSLYAKKKRWTVSEMLMEIGMNIKDDGSFLHQAALKGVSVFCPGITDGAFGFHLYMFQQEHDDFVVDVVRDMGKIVLSTSHDDIKGVICLGGGIAKHHAIFACLLNGGFDYAVYMTTARESSGSLSGATTDEAKSWGKIKDSSDAATVIGEVSITFPLVMSKALEVLSDSGAVQGE
jgi:deoxyhypusine synthase